MLDAVADEGFVIIATPYDLQALHPTPCTLHPTPHTLHLTPYTLRPAPYTLQLTPYTLHPTPVIIATPYNLQARALYRVPRA